MGTRPDVREAKEMSQATVRRRLGSGVDLKEFATPQPDLLTTTIHYSRTNIAAYIRSAATQYHPLPGWLFA